MSTIEKFVYLAAGLVLTMLVIGIGFTIYNNNRETTNAVIEQNNRLNNQLQESEWTQYQGTEVTGSEVINVIKRFMEADTYVSVDNGNGEIFYIYGDASLSSRLSMDEQTELLKHAKTRGDAAYINPNTRFIGKIDRDPTTEGILGIKFERATAATP